MEPDEMYRWVATRAVVDVPDFIKMPSRIAETLDHIHERGVCKKNRYGPPCDAYENYLQ